MVSATTRSRKPKPKPTTTATAPTATALDDDKKAGNKKDIEIKKHQRERKHKHQEFEFFGPKGAVLITILLPFTCFFLVKACNEEHGCVSLWTIFKHEYEFPKKMRPLLSLRSFLVQVGWFVWCLILHLSMPGTRKEGVILKNGERLEYKLNAFRVLVVTSVVISTLTWLDLIQLRALHGMFLSMLSAGCAFAFALTTFLYVASFRKDRGNDDDASKKKKKTKKNDDDDDDEKEVGSSVLLANGGNTGNVIYDWFIGRELNPRFSRKSTFDIKVFCELTPGLIGWLILNFSFMHEQFYRLGYVTKPMILVNMFQTVYVVDALWNEAAILTTMDVTTDGFGFMLVFGDLVWVPFTYSLQCRYIAENDVEISTAMTVLILMIQCIGYYTFRASNGQKNLFRTNPKSQKVKHLKSIKTQRGTNLLISGWWGIARHINYFGDWLMAWAWCLPCGFKHVAPYFYVIYFGILLVHRDLRDCEQCELKYGEDWKKYCRIVKYRIIPYVY